MYRDGNSPSERTWSGWAGSRWRRPTRRTLSSCSSTWPSSLSRCVCVSGWGVVVVVAVVDDFFYLHRNHFLLVPMKSSLTKNHSQAWYNFISPETTPPAPKRNPETKPPKQNFRNETQGGKAYVCHQTKDDIFKCREIAKVNAANQNKSAGDPCSPWRDRPTKVRFFALFCSGGRQPGITGEPRFVVKCTSTYIKVCAFLVRTAVHDFL